MPSRQVTSRKTPFTPNPVQTTSNGMFMYNEKAYPGAKLCPHHGWCSHSGEACKGKERSNAIMVCYQCKSKSHVYRDCLDRKQRAKQCDNGLGPHLLHECEVDFDLDVIFRNKKQTNKSFKSRAMERKPVSNRREPVALAAFVVLDGRNTPLPAERYTPALK